MSSMTDILTYVQTNWTVIFALVSSVLCFVLVRDILEETTAQANDEENYDQDYTGNDDSRFDSQEDADSGEFSDGDGCVSDGDGQDDDE
jgi:hypothetical protein